MRDLDTILGSKVGTAVRVNDLFAPVSLASVVLQSFCEPGIMHVNLEGFQISKSGSLFKCKLGSNYFAITTAHQFTNGDFQHDQLCLSDKRRQFFVTSGRCIFSSDDVLGEDHFDIRLYDFTEPVQNDALPNTGWFDLRNGNSESRMSERELQFCIGYPGELNNINYELPEYPATALAVDGFPGTPNLQHRELFVPTKTLRCNAAGFSGAPVFGVDVITGDPSINFRGIVTNGGQNQFHYTTAVDIQAFVEAAF